MKKIIFLFLALLVLIGAGIGGYLMFGPQSEGQVAEEPAEPKRPDGPPQFVEIGPLVVPVIGEKRVEQNVLLLVSLEVYGESTRESVRQVRPRLNDAFLRALYGGIHSGQVVNGQLLNVNAVRDTLMEASEQVLGPGVVWDVLIQAVNQRPAF